MYIPRSFDQQLLEWKQGKVRKPLLLRGARQVGKSSAVRHLGGARWKTFRNLFIGMIKSPMI